jgi:catechol 2,3-dioxygenase-like lactoylglutathione lyase family enzyme
VKRLSCLFAALLLAAQAAFAAGEVAAVGPLAFTVADASRSAAFLRDVLDFEPAGDVERAGDAVERQTGVFGTRLRVVTMRLGEERIELHEFLAPRGRPFPAGTRANDRWFQHAAIVVSDMAKAYAKLRAHDVEHASTGPQRLPDWNPNAAGIEAFYFRDPDGHFLELIAFPPGKGDPRWQRADGRLFLGIDHTAIVVADTEASLRFYRDTLGLSVAGGSENWGTEQEHLNNVFGARLRITTLRAPRGPGVELLEYLAPRDGRPRPLDARANDLLHWETVLVTRGGDGARLVADPDGHAVRLEGGAP